MERGFWRCGWFWETPWGIKNGDAVRELHAAALGCDASGAVRVLELVNRNLEFTKISLGEGGLLGCKFKKK